MCYQKNTIAILLLLIAIFMLRQHKLGYNVAKKSVEKGLYASISQWFMQMSLLLQHNNVHVSLAKSMKNAPVIIQKELEKLMERLEQKMILESVPALAVLTFMISVYMAATAF